MQIPAYNPGMLAREELERLFVVRSGELDLLNRSLRDFEAGIARQHHYVVGRRGMGKTTLLLRLAHQCRPDGKLPGLVAAILSEEQYGVGDLGDLWLEVGAALASSLEDEPFADSLQELLAEHGADGVKLAEEVLAAIKRRLAVASRKLVIFLDNFDDVLEAIGGEEEEHRLREELMDNRELVLIAASARAANATFHHNRALYEFFKIRLLQPLKRAEIALLLAVDDERETQARVELLLAARPERVAGIERLTGGNPRLVVLARKLLRESPLGDIRDDLRALLDQVTPYYKHLIEEIPRQARRVFHAVAGSWDPVRAADLEESLRLTSSVIRAQLSRLARDGWLVEVENTGKRATSYQLASRLFNLYYLMRYRRAERDRLRYWVRFIEAYYGLTEGHRAVRPMRQKLWEEECDASFLRGALEDGFDAASSIREEGSRGRALASLAAAAMRTALRHEFEEWLGNRPLEERLEIGATPAARYRALRQDIEERAHGVDGEALARVGKGLLECLSLRIGEKAALWVQALDLPPEKREGLIENFRTERELMAEHFGPTGYELLVRATTGGRLGPGLVSSGQFSAIPGLPADEDEASAAHWLWSDVGEDPQTNSDDILLLLLLVCLGGGQFSFEQMDWLLPRGAEILWARPLKLPSTTWTAMARVMASRPTTMPDALLCARRAVELDAESSTARLLLAQCQAETEGGLDSAIATLEEATTRFPNEFDLTMLLARLYWRAGLDEDELQARRKASEIRPDDTRPIGLLAIALARRNRWDEALVGYERCHELEPEEPRWYAGIGWASHRLDDQRGATQAFVRSLDLGLKETFWLRRALFCLRDLARPAAAIETTLRRLHEADATWANDLAWHLHETRPDLQREALELARAAVAQEPTAHCLHTLATVLLDGGDDSEAAIVASRHLAAIDDSFLDSQGDRRESLDLLVRLIRSGQQDAVLLGIQQAPLRAAWEPVELALRSRMADEPHLLANTAAEIADSARHVLALIDAPLSGPPPGSES